MSNLNTLGYQVLRNVIAADEIEGMRNAITETMDRVGRSLRAPFEMSCPSLMLENRLDAVWHKDRTYAQTLFRAALADSHRDERVQSMTTHRELSARVAELIAPLKRTGQTIRARASVPVFEDALTRWHQDVVDTADDGCGSVRVACWIPLMDVDQNSGALEVIPGSWPEPLPHVGERDGRFFIPPESLPEDGHRTIPLRRGDVLILDRFIPHRSLHAQNSHARWTIVMWVKAWKCNAG